LGDDVGGSAKGDIFMTVDRRTFVKGALGASGAVLLGGLGAVGGAGEDASRAGAAVRGAERARAANLALPPPAKSGIEHVIVVMMENRSFDHFLGWLPHADGKQAGLSYADPQGKSHATYHQSQFNGCGFTDPDHSYEGGRLQYNGGKMDGFLSDTANDTFAVGYYTAKDRPFMSRLAQAYTTCDRYFCAILGPTYPNRFFQHAAQTDRLDDAVKVSTLPTIWDQLNQPGGPTGRYYYSDVPYIALWGGKYSSISSPFSAFLSDVSTGQLPNVSYLDPKFVNEDTGTSADDHPLADIRAGDAFLSQVFHAVASGPGWDKTVLVINYDEWGGFFDHVVPPRITAGVPVGAAPSSGVDTDLNKEGKVLSGFRVPCIVVSPFTRIGSKQAAVTHNFYDHTSVLKLIEWRWGLQPLTQRDASHAPTDPGNLATALNFSRPVTKVPNLPVLAAFTPTACAATTPTTEPAGIAPADFVPTTGTHDSWAAALARSPLMDSWTTSSSVA
jgi:phospholipase C